MILGHLILVVGIILPMISFNYQDMSSQSELFYIYLLLSSVLYLIFVQIDLMYLR